MLSYYRKYTVKINAERRLRYKTSVEIRNNKKLYAKINKNKIQKRMKRYYSEYYEKNKELIKTKTYAYCRNKYKKDLNYRIASILRVSLNRAVKGKQKLGVSALKNLGCSIEYFKKHIASKFKRGMTWKNYGKYTWHLDHIKPLSKFSLKRKSDLLKACHYTNYQPLWAKENHAKGNRNG